MPRNLTTALLRNSPGAAALAGPTLGFRILQGFERIFFMKLLSRNSLLALVIAATGQLFTASAQIPRFLTPVSYPVPGAIMAVVADVNGDGILDIVTANGAAPSGDGGVSILFGLGSGKFKPAKKIVLGGSPSWLVVADFNNDGKLDIAVANEPNPNLGIV